MSECPDLIAQSHFFPGPRGRRFQALQVTHEGEAHPELVAQDVFDVLHPVGVVALEVELVSQAVAHPGEFQVWSLTRFYSVDFSKSGIGVKKVRLQQTHNQGLRQLLLTVSWDLRA